MPSFPKNEVKPEHARISREMVCEAIRALEEPLILNAANVECVRNDRETSLRLSYRYPLWVHSITFLLPILFAVMVIWGMHAGAQVSATVAKVITVAVVVFALILIIGFYAWTAIFRKRARNGIGLLQISVEGDELLTERGRFQCDQVTLIACNAELKRVRTSREFGSQGSVSRHTIMTPVVFLFLKEGTHLHPLTVISGGLFGLREQAQIAIEQFATHAGITWDVTGVGTLDKETSNECIKTSWQW